MRLRNKVRVEDRVISSFWLKHLGLLCAMQWGRQDKISRFFRALKVPRGSLKMNTKKG